MPAAARRAGFLLYRLAWAALFAAAVASLVWFDPHTEARNIRLLRAGQTIAFGLWQDQSAEGLMGAPFGDDGRRFGFRYADVLLTVDGHRVPKDTDAQIALLAGPTGVATLGVRRLGGASVTLRVPRDAGRGARAYAGSGLSVAQRRWTIFAAEALATVVSLLAAAMLFVRRPHDRVAQLLSFSLVLSRAGLLARLPGAPDVLVVAEPAAASSLLALAILLFPHGRFATRWHRVAFALVAAVQLYQVVQWLESFWSALSALPLLVTAAAMLVAITRQYRRMPPGLERQQIKFVLFGIVANSVLLAVTALLLLVESVPMSVGTLGWFVLVKRVAWALSGIAVPAGLLVSLLRYRLYDAETAISRSVAYGALTLSLVAVFAGSEKVIEMLGEGWFGEQLGRVASALAAAVAAATIAPLHGRVTRWAERRFQGDLVHLRHGLPLLAGDLRETAAPAALADAMLSRVEAGVRAAHGAVLAGEALIATRDVTAEAMRGWLRAHDLGAPGDARLVCDRDDAFVPLRVPLHADGVGLVGWLLLGPRPDGSFYGRDERETLVAIADPVARALGIAIERERRAAERHARDQGVERRMEALCRFVHERFGVDLAAAAAAPPDMGEDRRVA